MAIFNAHSRDRLQTFIDGQNLFGTLRALERKIDYKSLMETMKEQTRLVRAQYFTTVSPQQDVDGRLDQVLNVLEFNGYSIYRKETREAQDQFGNVRTKGTILVPLALAMVSAADNGSDHIVLFSGDGELAPAVNACKDRDCRVTVVSSERTRAISEDLRRACDQYIDLEDLPEGIILDRAAVLRAA